MEYLSLKLFCGGLSSMYHKMERNAGVDDRFRYEKRKCRRISLVLILTVFPAFFICRFASASDNESSMFNRHMGSVKASDSVSFNGSSRSLDSILQEYAFKAFDRHKTGIVYEAPVPENLYGIVLRAVRLKSGSLYYRGIMSDEFEVPVGVSEQPYVERLILVYQNLGNWSSLYYSYPGYNLVGPVLGLLAYDASNLSALNLPELEIVATKKPILIHFPEVGAGSMPTCISFYLNGSVSLSNVSSGNVCSTNYQGHFALLAKSLAPSPAPMVPSPVTPSPAPSTPTKEKKKKSNTWKIVGGSVLGAVVLLVLVAFMGFGSFKYRQKSKIARMEQQADQGEALQTTLVGSSRAPAAGGTRTQPMLENEYIA